MPAITIDQLPEDVFVYVSIETFASFQEVSVFYSDKSGNENGLGKLVACSATERYSMNTQKENLGCEHVWELFQADAKKGYGPLLFDVMMEVVSNKLENGKGIFRPDSNVMSDDATKVFDFYFGRNDVQKVQLDNEKNQLTPQKSDNCIQRPAFKRSHEKWFQDSLSKGYRKGVDLLKSPKVIGFWKGNQFSS